MRRIALLEWARGLSAILIVLSGFGLPAFGQCVSLPIGNTGWWPGDGSGADVVGGRNAILHNGTAYDAGQVGQAFRFDGSNDDASVPHTAALNVGSGDFTVDFWVKPDADSGEQVMVEKWDENSNSGWTLSDRGGLYFAGTGSSIQTSAQITPGVWSHVALRRSSGTVAVFLDGVEIQSTVDNSSFDNTVPLLFGRRRGGQGFFWDGMIDEIHYFVGTALSNAEIQAIHDAGTSGACAGPECGDGNAEGGEACDDGNGVEGDGCDSNCTVSACGNGIRAGNEACDDGNSVEGDGCDSDCTISCGNGVVTPPEACDDGNSLNGDGCESDCTISGPCAPVPVDLSAWWPGDGGTADIQGGFNAIARNGAGFTVGRIRQAFNLDGVNDFIEIADDPSLDVGAGDFTVDLWVRFNDTGGEQVLIEKYVESLNDTSTGWALTKLSGNVIRLATPHGNADSRRLTLPAGVWTHVALRRSAATFAVFVNGAQVAAAPASGDLSSPASLKLGHRGSPFDTPGSLDTRGFYLNGQIDEVHLIVGRGLGDAEIQAIAASGGSGLCVAPSVCGNGVIEAGEPCDDGNAMTGDGCEVDCSLSCGNGNPDPGEACDDGNGVDGDGCDQNCSVSACGNAVVAGSETCEDGNVVDGDGCDSNCTLTECGNGVVTAEEACDDGNTSDGDGCEGDCSVTPVVETAPPGGSVTTDPGNEGATPQAPIQTTLTTPDGGIVSIATSEEPLTPAGVQALVRSLLIEAPPATPQAPLSIAIRIDASAIPQGLDLLHVTLTRDGLVIENCSGAPGTADPDPCIASRVLEMDGDVVLTGLTSHASIWGVVARGLFEDEQKCANGAARKGAGVAKAQAKANAACLKLAAKGGTSDPQACLLADSSGKVAASKAKTVDLATDFCVPAPSFGFTDAAMVNTAAQDAAVAVMSDLFGANLNMAIAPDDAGAGCQAAALKATYALFNLNVGLFLKCEKTGLVGDPTPMVSGAQLATCLDALTLDAKRLKSASKLGKTIASKCAGNVAAALPGLCGSARNPAYCIATRVGCRVCQMVNGFAELGRDCDLFDDFTANGSCN